MKLPKYVSGNIRLSKKEHYDANATQTLHNELAKGVRSMKNGDVFTLDEAWKEIDLI